jgi:hypothetical protein
MTERPDANIAPAPRAKPRLHATKRAFDAALLESDLQWLREMAEQEQRSDTKEDKGIGS